MTPPSSLVGINTQRAFHQNKDLDYWQMSAQQVLFRSSESLPSEQGFRPLCFQDAEEFGHKGLREPSIRTRIQTPSTRTARPRLTTTQRAFHQNKDLDELEVSLVKDFSLLREPSIRTRIQTLFTSSIVIVILLREPSIRTRIQTGPFPRQWLSYYFLREPSIRTRIQTSDRYDYPSHTDHSESLPSEQGFRHYQSALYWYPNVSESLPSEQGFDVVSRLTDSTLSSESLPLA